MLGYIKCKIHQNITILIIIIIIIILNNNNVDHLTEIACSVSFLRRLYHQPPIMSHSVLRIIIIIVIIIIIDIVIFIIIIIVIIIFIAHFYAIFARKRVIF